MDKDILALISRDKDVYKRQQISLGVLIVDARHKPTADDLTMAEWFKGSGRPFAVAANKVDKLSKTCLLYTSCRRRISTWSAPSAE